MRYTQSQVRELLGVPLQTYRYWAGLIPHLATRTGKGALFTTGDVLGLALTKEVCTGLGLSVGQLTIGLEKMFGILDAAPWPTMRGCILLLSIGQARFATLTELAEEAQIEAATVMVPCGPIMNGLRASLLQGAVPSGSSQGELALFGAITGGKTVRHHREAPPSLLRSSS